MGNNTGFTFGTWNVGTSAADYEQLIRNREEASNQRPNIGSLSPYNRPDDQAFLDSINKVRDVLLSDIATRLAPTVDVFALQEVANYEPKNADNKSEETGNEPKEATTKPDEKKKEDKEQRPDISVLEAKGFQIIRPPVSRPENALYTDTAIAIHPRKFKDIENRSFTDHIYDADFAIAVATEKATGKKVAFISGHIAGFNLEDPNPINLKEGATLGDGSIKQLIERLKTECSDCDTLLLGADMNSIPEIYKDRFKLFEDAGFTLHRTGAPTSNLSRKLGTVETAKLQERELDYVFTKHKKPTNRFSAFLGSLFKKETVHVTQIVDSKVPLSLDPISSPSDHIPVFVRVDTVKKKSLIGRSLNAINNTFQKLSFKKIKNENA
ncbi:MAG: hypothetical protein K0S74_1749 [Chlamydiales bacterium]|jgi:hypothetical protein|nr:hypothetical protein [Chlamydiales bacterium]